MNSFEIKHLAVLSLAISLVSCAGSKRPIDSQIALAANDYSGLIEGCGHQLNSGFISCRLTEGSVANQNLYFVGPKAECDGKEPCITFKIFFPNGEPSFGGAIPKGETRAAVSWRDILKRDTFEASDRGFWGFSYQIRYKDPETGAERKAYSQGEIYLRVLKKDYINLHDIPEDHDFFWKWDENGVPVKITSGMRTFVGQKKEEQKKETKK